MKTKKKKRKKISKRIKRKISKRFKRNPGGGWEFVGVYAKKWKAYRYLGRELFDSNRGYVEVKDKDEWWKVFASRNGNTITIEQVVEPSELKYRFSGKAAGEWIDWRIGFNSQGPELQDSKGRWWSANAIKRGSNIDVMDIRYEVKD